MVPLLVKAFMNTATSSSLRPSVTILSRTAPRGTPTAHILAYFEYLGSVFSASFAASAASPGACSTGVAAGAAGAGAGVPLRHATNAAMTLASRPSVTIQQHNMLQFQRN